MKERGKKPPDQVVLKVRYETKRAFQDAVARNPTSWELYVATETPFDVGQKFPIEIDLPKKKEWIKGMCEVVWVNRRTNNYPKWIYGLHILKGIAPQQLHKGMEVRFVHVPPKYRRRLEEYLGVVATVEHKEPSLRRHVGGGPTIEPMPAFL